GGSHVSGAAGGAAVSPGLLWLPPEEIGSRRDRGLPAAVLEVRLGDRSRCPEVLRHRSLGPRGSGGGGGHRLPLRAALCQALAESAAAAPGRHACAAKQGNPARIGDLAGPGEPVFALRVRYVDGPEVLGLPV